MGFKVALGKETGTQVWDEHCFRGVVASMGSGPLAARRIEQREINLQYERGVSTLVNVELVSFTQLCRLQLH